MAEFPDLGRHCALKSCNKLDYTPFRCSKCEKFYCGNHRLSHGCIMDENVIEQPTSQSETIKKFLCSMTGCFNYEITKFDCSLCEKNYCMKHRISEEHCCVGLKRNDPTTSKTSVFPTKSETAKPIEEKPKFVRKLDPTAQARADKIAIMKAKSKNPQKIPPDEMLVIFIWVSPEERVPFLVSKLWSVGKVADVIISQGRVKKPAKLTKVGKFLCHLFLLGHYIFNFSDEAQVVQRF